MNIKAMDNEKLICPECGGTNIDILEDEAVAVCTDCWLEWPYNQ